MEGIYLTADELDALHGVGPLGACLYVWLRSWMDLRTGRVGVSRTISLAMLAAYAECHVPKGGGYQITKPSERNIRTALGALARAGLLVRLGTELLVFRLPKAKLLTLASGKPDTNPTGGNDTESDTESDTNPTVSNASSGAGFGDVAKPNPTRNPTRNPTGVKPTNLTHIRDRGKPSTSQAASTTVNEGGADQVLRLAAALAARGSDESPLDEETSRKLQAVYECLRGAAVDFNALDRDRLVGWVHQSVTPAQVHAAVQIARQRRAADGSQQRITVAYLAAILPDVIKPPKPKGPPWWSSDAAMQAKAREIGIPDARPGESREQFKARIEAVIRQQGDAA